MAMAAAAAARALASASSSSPAAARYSLALFVLFKRFSAVSSAGAASVSRITRFGPFSSAVPNAENLHDLVVLGNARLNQVRCMVRLPADAASETTNVDGEHTAVKEWYEKMLKSLEAETVPPNTWLWSLIENCSTQEDINLLFQMLQNLRRFRLSNLRIHTNFNCHLCLKVTEACARTGALDYGKKTLHKHNVYGLTPTIGSAHYLLLYAKEHNDSKLMVGIMKLLQRNSLSLQPGTADIVFRLGGGTLPGDASCGIGGGSWRRGCRAFPVGAGGLCGGARLEIFSNFLSFLCFQMTHNNAAKTLIQSIL